MFAKGQSGNPSGRPKENEHIKLLARTHSPEAIATLAHWMKQKKDAKSSVAAAIALLDRGYGKPAAQLDLNHHGNFNLLINK